MNGEEGDGDEERTGGRERREDEEHSKREFYMNFNALEGGDEYARIFTTVDRVKLSIALAVGHGNGRVAAKKAANSLGHPLLRALLSVSLAADVSCPSRCFLRRIFM